jgi:hypothetical protein
MHLGLLIESQFSFASVRIEVTSRHATTVVDRLHCLSTTLLLEQPWPARQIYTPTLLMQPQAFSRLVISTGTMAMATANTHTHQLCHRSHCVFCAESSP